MTHPLRNALANYLTCIPECICFANVTCTQAPTTFQGELRGCGVGCCACVAVATVLLCSGACPWRNALDRTTGATFARSQEVQPILGAAVTTAVTFLQQRKLLRADNRRALYPLRDWVWRVEEYGYNQIRTAIAPSEFVYVWLDVVWASLISEAGTARLV